MATGLQSLYAAECWMIRGRNRIFSCRTFAMKTTTSLSSSRPFDTAKQPLQQQRQDLDYCINVVREKDMESFYCGLLMPPGVQKAYFALRAFNAEIASIKGEHHARSRTTTPSTATTAFQPSTIALQIRLQWWNDAIRQIYGEQPARSPDPSLLNLSISCWKSPIVRALHTANQEHKFTRRFLERLIEARQSDLDINQYSTVQDMANYAEYSVSSLLYLTLECFGLRDDAADEVASYAGVGIGLTTALRATVFRLVNDEVTIPSNLLGLSFPYDQLKEQLFVGGDSSMSEEDTKEWQNAVKTMTNTAATYLDTARDKQGQVPKSARTALLPVVPALLYLARLEKCKHNVLDPTLLEPERVKMMMVLARTWLTGVL